VILHQGAHGREEPAGVPSVMPYSRRESRVASYSFMRWTGIGSLLAGLFHDLPDARAVFRGMDVV